MGVHSVFIYRFANDQFKICLSKKLCSEGFLWVLHQFYNAPHLLYRFSIGPTPVLQCTISVLWVFYWSYTSSTIYHICCVGSLLVLHQFYNIPHLLCRFSMVLHQFYNYTTSVVSVLYGPTPILQLYHICSVGSLLVLHQFYNIPHLLCRFSMVLHQFYNVPHLLCIFSIGPSPVLQSTISVLQVLYWSYTNSTIYHICCVGSLWSYTSSTIYHICCVGSLWSYTSSTMYHICCVCFLLVLHQFYNIPHLLCRFSIGPIPVLQGTISVLYILYWSFTSSTIHHICSVGSILVLHQFYNAPQLFCRFPIGPTPILQYTTSVVSVLYGPTPVLQCTTSVVYVFYWSYTSSTMYHICSVGSLLVLHQFYNVPHLFCRFSIGPSPVLQCTRSVLQVLYGPTPVLQCTTSVLYILYWSNTSSTMYHICSVGSLLVLHQFYNLPDLFCRFPIGPSPVGILQNYNPPYLFCRFYIGPTPVLQCTTSVLQVLYWFYTSSTIYHICCVGPLWSYTSSTIYHICCVGSLWSYTSSTMYHICSVGSLWSYTSSTIYQICCVCFLLVLHQFYNIPHLLCRFSIGPTQQFYNAPYLFCIFSIGPSPVLQSTISVLQVQYWSYTSSTIYHICCVGSLWSYTSSTIYHICSVGSLLVLHQFYNIPHLLCRFSMVLHQFYNIPHLLCRFSMVLHQFYNVPDLFCRFSMVLHQFYNVPHLFCIFSIGPTPVLQCTTSVLQALYWSYTSSTMYHICSVGSLLVLHQFYNPPYLFCRFNIGPTPVLQYTTSVVSVIYGPTPVLQYTTSVVSVLYGPTPVLQCTTSVLQVFYWSYTSSTMYHICSVYSLLVPHQFYNVPHLFCIFSIGPTPVLQCTTSVLQVLYGPTPVLPCTTSVVYVLYWSFTSSTIYHICCVGSLLVLHQFYNAPYLFCIFSIGPSPVLQSTISVLQVLYWSYSNSIMHHSCSVGYLLVLHQFYNIPHLLCIFSIGPSPVLQSTIYVLYVLYWSYTSSTIYHICCVGSLWSYTSSTMYHICCVCFLLVLHQFYNVPHLFCRFSMVLHQFYNVPHLFCRFSIGPTPVLQCTTSVLYILYWSYTSSTMYHICCVCFLLVLHQFYNVPHLFCIFSIGPTPALQCTTSVLQVLYWSYTSPTMYHICSVGSLLVLHQFYNPPYLFCRFYIGPTPGSTMYHICSVCSLLVLHQFYNVPHLFCRFSIGSTPVLQCTTSVLQVLYWSYTSSTMYHICSVGSLLVLHQFYNIPHLLCRFSMVLHQFYNIPHLLCRFSMVLHQFYNVPHLLCMFSIGSTPVLQCTTSVLQVLYGPTPVLQCTTSVLQVLYWSYTSSTMYHICCVCFLLVLHQFYNIPHLLWRFSIGPTQVLQSTISVLQVLYWSYTSSTVHHSCSVGSLWVLHQFYNPPYLFCRFYIGPTPVLQCTTSVVYVFYWFYTSSTMYHICSVGSLWSYTSSTMYHICSVGSLLVLHQFYNAPHLFCRFSIGPTPVLQCTTSVLQVPYWSFTSSTIHHICYVGSILVLHQFYNIPHLLCRFSMVLHQFYNIPHLLCRFSIGPTPVLQCTTSVLQVLYWSYTSSTMYHICCVGSLWSYTSSTIYHICSVTLQNWCRTNREPTQQMWYIVELVQDHREPTQQMWYIVELVQDQYRTYITDMVDCRTGEGPIGNLQNRCGILQNWCRTIENRHNRCGTLQNWCRTNREPTEQMWYIVELVQDQQRTYRTDVVHCRTGVGSIENLQNRCGTLQNWCRTNREYTEQMWYVVELVQDHREPTQQMWYIVELVQDHREPTQQMWYIVELVQDQQGTYRTAVVHYRIGVGPIQNLQNRYGGLLNW